MSTNINANVLKKFILQTVGTHMTAKEAQKLDVKNEYNTALEDLDTNTLDLNDIIKNDDLYEQFATLYVTEQEKKEDTKNEERDKEEQAKVKDKNGAGV